MGVGILNILCPNDFSKEEVNEYVKYVIENRDDINDESDIDTIKISEGEKPDTVNIDVTLKKTFKFERIRRITGYLVGDLNRWNDAKQAEEKARIKHA